MNYFLTNSGSAPVNYTAVSNAVWLSAVPSSGSLPVANTAVVSVFVNASANTLPSGSYSGRVTFTNITNGIGNTTREFYLNVYGVGSMSVFPLTGTTFSGSVGGPFGG